MHVIIGEKLYDADYVHSYTSGFDELSRKVEEFTPDRVAAWTGIAAADILALAREYATTRPAVIRANYGLQRSERGGMATRLIALLPALTGSWRDIGGGLQLSTSGGFRFDLPALQLPSLQKISLGREARIVNMSALGDALTTLQDPPVKAMVVYCSNPAAVAPDQNTVFQGLKRPDLFTVVLEQLQTDTANFADILLPSTTFLEHTDVYLAYGHYYLQLARPALPAPGECRSNVHVFRDLAHRMGFTDACFDESEDDMIRGLLSSGHPFLEGITLERLERERSVRLNVSAPGEPFLPFAQGNFGTASGRCEFQASTISYEPPTESRGGDRRLHAQFPLELVSPKNHDNMNSTFGERDDTDRDASVATLHPDDAAHRQIADGDWIRIFNQRGACMLRACVAPRVKAGVVSVPSTRWTRRAPDGRNINALTSQRLSDMGGGATFYSCLVEVERIGD